jgi:amino acid transporter
MSAPVTTENVGLLTGILVAMWNYMGWDNASTVAAEVDEPRRTYPRAMLLAVAIVALSYIVPIAAMAGTGIPRGAWETGSWATLAALVAGPWLRDILVAGGMLSAFGMFNALVMSYSRLPLAMAQDGMLPRIFLKRTHRSDAPWVAIIMLAMGWAACVNLDFEHLVTLDIFLYGLSLVLEFAALVALRVREPELSRPFRVPGGLPGAVLVGVAPALLIALAVRSGAEEHVGRMSSLALGCWFIAAGLAAYAMVWMARHRIGRAAAGR